MKKQIKPYGYGSYTPEKVKQAMQGNSMAQREDGDWEPAKALPYWSFKERLIQAWHVFTYKADALYWYFPKGYKRDQIGLNNKK